MFNLYLIHGSVFMSVIRLTRAPHVGGNAGLQLLLENLEKGA